MWQNQNDIKKGFSQYRTFRFDQWCTQEEKKKVSVMFKIEVKNILAGKKYSRLDFGSLLRLGSYNLKTEYDAI